MPLYMKIDGITGPIQKPTQFQGSFVVETVQLPPQTTFWNPTNARELATELFVSMRSNSVDVYKLAFTGEPRDFTIWFVRETGATFRIVKLLDARITHYSNVRAGSDSLDSLHLEFTKIAYHEFGPPVHK